MFTLLPPRLNTSFNRGLLSFYLLLMYSLQALSAHLHLLGERYLNALYWSLDCLVKIVDDTRKSEFTELLPPAS